MYNCISYLDIIIDNFNTIISGFNGDPTFGGRSDGLFLNYSNNPEILKIVNNGANNYYYTEFNSIVSDNSGNYYLGGFTNIVGGDISDTKKNGSGQNDGLLVKIDSSGNILWTKTYASPSNIGSMVLYNNELYLTGVTQVYKADLNGNIILTKSSNAIQYNELKIDSNNQYLYAVGEDFSQNGLVTKFDLNFNQVWNYSTGIKANLKDFIFNTSSEIIVVGNQNTIQTTTGNITLPIMAKINTSGAEIWKQDYFQFPIYPSLISTTAKAKFNSIVKLNNKFYIVGQGSGTTAIWLEIDEI